jgi:hypothetical protein
MDELSRKLKTLGPGVAAEIKAELAGADAPAASNWEAIADHLFHAVLGYVQRMVATAVAAESKQVDELTKRVAALGSARPLQ